MQIVNERCCGLDVHKNSIVACVITPQGKETKTFGTMTGDIKSFVSWAKAKGCTHVAMESTGVYWKPIYNLLEQTEIKILVVNARHIKAVPGRKTDVKDAEWIADLLRHGLLQGSFIPDREQRELRELVRYRRSLVDEHTRELQRMDKTLEGANIKLSSVVSDIGGVSARAMIKSIVNGAEDPKVLAKLAKGSMKKKHNELVQALHGLIGDHQIMMLSTQLRHIEFLDQEIVRLDKEIQERISPFEAEVVLLDTIPGVGRRTAEQIIAEIGTDMDRFPSTAQLCSWAGMAPGNNESAGKKKSGRTRKGNKSLRATLVQAANAAGRSKNSYLSAQYHRISGRRGKKRAAVAVGHTILAIAYHILKTGQPYKELGRDFLEKRNKNTIVNHTVKRLEELGYKVAIEVA